MKRREIITVLGGGAMWPLTAHAQKAIPVIGFLSTLSKAQAEPPLGAFMRGLNESGFKEGQNVEITYQFAEGQFDRLSAMAKEMVRARVSLILAQAPPAALAAKAATSDIPIVFVVGFDPVAGGLVASLSRPGGNATGMTLISYVLGQKRLEMLLELVPKASRIGMLVNPDSPDTAAEVEAVEAGARALKLQLTLFNATSPSGIDAAFSALKETKSDALIVATDPFLLNSRHEVLPVRWTGLTII